VEGLKNVPLDMQLNVARRSLLFTVIVKAASGGGAGCGGSGVVWYVCVKYDGLKQWFPTFLISRPHSKIFHKRLAPDITYNSKDVRITTDKIRNTLISRVGFTVFTLLCKRKEHLC